VGDMIVLECKKPAVVKVDKLLMRKIGGQDRTIYRDSNLAFIFGSAY
jgi:hypothetical protein